MRKTARIALLMAAVTGLSGFAAAPATAAPVVTLDTGHVDIFGVAYESGAFDLHIHDEANEAEYAPDEALLVVKPVAKTTVPADPAYAFLGTPGAPVWVLPEIEDPDLLWPGIAAEEVEAGVFVDGSLRLRVVGVCGPDDFSIFTTDAVGAPNVLVDSGNGLPDSITLTPGGHRHSNWAFEAAGHYSITVRAVGTLAATGKRVASAPATYSFEVNA